MSCTLFIDESGDTGIDSSNDMQSPYFILGAYLVRNKNLDMVRESIRCTEALLKKPIHFSGLKHEKKVFCCTQFSMQPIKAFGLISNKQGLDLGGYRQTISKNSDYFYNKNVHYLLEMVGKFAEENKISVDSIIFEKINNKNYEQLKRYLSVISTNPIHQNAKLLKHLSFQKIEALKKGEENLLKIADVIAHSLYRTCIPHRFGGIENKYVEMLKNKFYGNKDGFILDHGIKIVPRGLSFSGLDNQYDFFKCLNTNSSFPKIEKIA